jgi:hypothetical protein
MIHPRVVRRFEDKVLKGRIQCFHWRGAFDINGYGIIKIDKKIFKAHRVAYAIANGLELDDLPGLLGHKCGNRWCVNAKHLVPGKSDYIKGGYRP